MAMTHEIEQGLAQERQALAETLVALRERLTPAHLAAEGKQVFVAQAAPLVSRLDGALRGRPVAAVVAGVALATLAFGRRSDGKDPDAAAQPALAGTTFEALARWEDEGGPPLDEPLDPEEAWLTEARGLRKTANRLLAKIDDAARRGVASTAQLARHRADVIAALASDTQLALAKGLEPLAEAARDQALRARERLYLARLAAEEKARLQVQDHPLLSGAIVAGVGAILACLFPQSETENRLIGKARDGLVDDLQDLVRREALKASDLASTLERAFFSDLGRVRSFLAPSVTRKPPSRLH